MLDRVVERRRAAQLARHYRDQERVSIAEIARRLGRAEATIKSVSLRSNRREGTRGQGALPGSVSRLRGAHRATERQGRRLRVLQTLPSRRDRAGMDPGTGSRSDARMASALRRCAVSSSSYDWSRTHARRRGGEALKRLHAAEWPAPSTVTDLYGAWASARADAWRRLNARATMPLFHGPSLCAWSSVNASADGRRTRHGHSSLQQQRGRRRSVTAGPGGATARCAGRSPRIGLPASTSTTLATAAKQAYRLIPPEVATIDDGAVPEIGEMRDGRVYGAETCIRVGARTRSQRGCRDSRCRQPARPWPDGEP